MIEHHRAAPQNPSRIVVVGAGGFVGKAVMAAAASAGIQTLGITRAEIDLINPAAVDGLSAQLRADDAVVLISAKAPARDASLLTDNILMGKHFCQAWAKQPGAHLIYVSSDAVYSDAAHHVSEATPPSPDSLHGGMHLARELMLRSVAGAAPLAILRPTLLYGPGDPHNGYGPNRFARLSKAHETIKLFGEGEETRDHVLVDNLAAIAIAAAQRLSAGVLNVATGQSISFRNAAEVISTAYGPVAVEGTPRRNPITHRHFDVTALLKAFPHVAITPFGAGVTALAAMAPLKG